MSDTPLDPARFAAAMAALGPFEAAPELAVAVSGGADSMALILQAAAWARAQGGRAVALTVDHLLRPDSTTEARQVGAWLAARGIEHHILTWQEAQSGPDLQAAARRARYALLEGWCRDHHILHLLLAHHRDDQAETLLLRLERGSGVDGLAAMAAQSFRRQVQLLRPLLELPATELRAGLGRIGQPWLEDPSNRSARFARVRWRQAIAAGHLPAARLALTAAQLGRARQALEADMAALAAETVVLRDAGFAWLALAPWRQAPAEIALRLLAALVRTVGGAEFPPRLQGLERLRASLLAGPPRRRTFAGVVLAPHDGRLLLLRESRPLAADLPLTPGLPVLWDNRFSVTLAAGDCCRLGALGVEAAKACRTAAKKAGIPMAVLPTLPAVMDKHGILAVPPLGYDRTGTGSTILGWGFTPAYPLAGAAFRLVKAPARTM